MSDHRLRELERTWKQTGSTQDQVAWLRERLRLGQLTEDRLRLAAYLDHRPSSDVVGWRHNPGAPSAMAAFDEWVMGIPVRAPWTTGRTMECPNKRSWSLPGSCMYRCSRCQGGGLVPVTAECEAGVRAATACAYAVWYEKAKSYVPDGLEFRLEHFKRQGFAVDPRERPPAFLKQALALIELIWAWIACPCEQHASQAASAADHFADNDIGMRWIMGPAYMCWSQSDSWHAHYREAMIRSVHLLGKDRVEGEIVQALIPWVLDMEDSRG